jgi:hypothetical protein
MPDHERGAFLALILKDIKDEVNAIQKARST